MLRPYTASPAPSLPVSGFDVVLRDPRREHGARLRIHVDRLRSPHREIAEQHHLGERAGVLGDVRPRWLASFAGGDPLGIDALGPGVLLWHRMRGDFSLLGIIQEPRVLAVNARDQLAGIADPELPARVERPG